MTILLCTKTSTERRLKTERSGKYLISLFLTASLFLFWYKEYWIITLIFLLIVYILRKSKHLIKVHSPHGCTNYSCCNYSCSSCVIMWDSAQTTNVAPGLRDCKRFTSACQVSAREKSLSTSEALQHYFRLPNVYSVTRGDGGKCQMINCTLYDLDYF